MPIIAFPKRFLGEAEGEIHDLPFVPAALLAPVTVRA
jgi:hypothetical protein